RLFVVVLIMFAALGLAATNIQFLQAPSLNADGRNSRTVLHAAEVDRAHVVGHDWGGGVAWSLAGSHVDRVASLTALSTPHPAAMNRAFRSFDQARRSWYMGAFQIPWLPERVLSVGFEAGL
ncbi:MAG TPA: alpha/beta fold hydrolase, partial [Dermatophilaceae bacterium]|nr:alpha/beta fold hydrolase [Dermatophilaceae bacterium]